MPRSKKGNSLDLEAETDIGDKVTFELGLQADLTPTRHARGGRIPWAKNMGRHRTLCVSGGHGAQGDIVKA